MSPDPRALQILTRGDFRRALRAHAWHYQYSSNMTQWWEGDRQYRRLLAAHAELRCPYDFSWLRAWALGLKAGEEGGCTPEQLQLVWQWLTGDAE